MFPRFFFLDIREDIFDYLLKEKTVIFDNFRRSIMQKSIS